MSVIHDEAKRKAEFGRTAHLGFVNHDDLGAAPVDINICEQWRQISFQVPLEEAGLQAIGSNGRAAGRARSWRRDWRRP